MILDFNKGARNTRHKDDFSEYLLNIEKSKEGYVNLNYNFLAKIYSELTDSQKIKLKKILDHETTNISKAV